MNGTETNGGWYEIYRNNDRTDWKWHYTTGSTTTSNSRVGVKPPDSLLLDLDATADWVRYYNNDYRNRRNSCKIQVKNGS